MDRLRPRQPYQTLPSSESVPQYHDRNAGIELRSRSRFTSSESASSLDEPLNGVPTTESSTSWRRRFSGWRVGTLGAALAVILSLILNVAVAIWLSQHAVFQDGLAELIRGDCGKIERMNTLVHLAINMLSTLMLSGSNYTMQVLVGPSRQEVDRAHQKGRWLDIGVPSLRNLRSISPVRAWLWGVLVASSLPLHLMFNSAFYATLATNDYDVFSVTESFLSGATATGYPASFVDLESLRQQMGTFENLTNADCIRAYAQDIVTDRRNLIIVSSNISSNALLYAHSYTFDTAIIPWMPAYTPYSWICDKSEVLGVVDPYTCYLRVPKLISHASEWTPFDAPAMYCLSERVPANCSFNANLPIIVTVIACNVVKAMVMVYVALSTRDNPLLVVGDAVASFLAVPDETTTYMCLLTRNDATASGSRERIWPVNTRQQRDLPPLRPKRATPKRSSWASASSGRRWSVTVILLISCITAVTGLLVAAIKSIPRFSAAVIQNLGFGRVSGEALIAGSNWAPEDLESAPAQILASILIANTPQIILSLLYFNINGLLTGMFMADEWSRFAVQRKSLRVSMPRGNQRSTYFLQLPYRIGVPLLFLSTLLHWLISQSIFLAVISEWDSKGNLTAATQIATCGFSPLPIILTLCLGVMVFVGLVVQSFKQYNPFIPLVASCSAAIAAACHAPGEKDDMVLKPLQWGVVRPSMSYDDVPVESELVGHCCFSSEEVTTPVASMLYAGLPSEES